MNRYGLHSWSEHHHQVLPTEKSRPRRKERIMMRRTVLLLVSTALALIAAGGIALAATFTCTTNPCDGTTDDDVITGTVNAETINGKAGNDEISAGGANDTLNGEDGNDTMHGENGTDRLNGGAGNDHLDGGGGGTSSDPHTTEDVYTLTTNWDQDTITDADGTDMIMPADGATAAAMPNLTVDLVSGPGPEYTDGNGNTVNWNDNVVERAITGAGDDVISQTPKKYNGMNGGAGSDTYTGYTTEPFGGDDIQDPGGTADVLELSSINLADASWDIWKNTTTGNVQTLQLWIGAPGLCFEDEFCRFVNLYRYFDNTNTNVCASGPGPGLIETIKFKDDPNVDFAQVKSLLGCDTTPPTVNDTSPDNNTTGIASTANVSATFSEDMDRNTLTTSTFTLTKQGSTSTLAATLIYDSASKKATLDPASDLEANTTYTARVKGGSSGAKDLAGNALEQDYSWTFTTPTPPPDTTAPKVGPVSPANSATGVARSTDVAATFSENMDPTSINATTFKLFKCSSTTSTTCTTTQITNVTVSLSADGLRATLNPYGTSST
jgi:Big-like domain-containing protein/hemolysin type calcium-binding protein